MFYIWFSFVGLDQIIADFGRAQAKLAQGFEEPLGRTRDALWQAIRELFASSGRSTARGAVPFPWAMWSPMTIAMRIEERGYYGTVPSSGEGTIGVWSGEMRDQLASDRGAGYAYIADDRLEIGLEPGAGDKWVEFIMGRTDDPPQPARVVYGNIHAEDKDNIHAEEVTLDVFTNWLSEIPVFQEAIVDAMWR